jgi:signal transduction histidine kinase
MAAARLITLALGGVPRAPARIDVPAVERAVTNLLDNAIRHAPAGTAVTVDVAVSVATVAVTVGDHGPGIPADAQAHVFDRFWRGAGPAHGDPGDARGGAGLGLAIARQVAEAHGGALSLRSPGPAGVGCVFTLALRR